MTFLSFLLRLIVPVVSAEGLEQLGAGSPGISEMWDQIKATFPFTDVGAGGLNFVGLKIIHFVLMTSGGVAVLMILYAGFKMVVASSEEGFGEAKKILLYTSIGLVAISLGDVVIAYAISLLQQAAG